MSKPRGGRGGRAERKAAGEIRNSAWARLTPAQKLADLDRRLGPGIGATRQRKLLAWWRSITGFDTFAKGE